MTQLSPNPRAYDVLLRAVSSAECELELVDIRALAAAHQTGRSLEEIDSAIADRRRALVRSEAAPAE